MVNGRKILALAARKIEILLFRLVDCLSPRICEEAQTFESQMIHYRLGGINISAFLMADFAV